MGRVISDRLGIEYDLSEEEYHEMITEIETNIQRFDYKEASV